MPTQPVERDTASRFAQFQKPLNEPGPRKALADLLTPIDYRFIGVFRFQDGRANAAIHFDRENPDQLRAQEVPETATYCCFVRDSRGAFTTVDAVLDDRQATHPARADVRAYCGVLILTPEGGFIGTLCHYDVVPRDAAQIDFELILQAASALARSGKIPPYPAD